MGGYYIGKWYAAEYKVFRSKLNHLDFVVRHACVEPLFKEGIEDLFNEIKQFDCGNQIDLDQIKELETLFKERFKEISIN